MNCLVCENQIRIETLKQLLRPVPSFICSRCELHLIRKSDEVLYVSNDWLLAVIDRLNRGDVTLIQLFEADLRKLIKKKGYSSCHVVVQYGKDKSVFPWIELLVEAVKPDKKVEDGQNWVFSLYNSKEVAGISFIEKTTE